MNNILARHEKKKYKKRVLWTKDHEDMLEELYLHKGKKSWTFIASELNKKFSASRTGKQCREKCITYFDPKLKATEWEREEKLALPVLQKIFGNQWSYLITFISQRSEVAIKCRFYSQIRKVIKAFRKNCIPESIISNDEKMFQFCSTIELLRSNYCPYILANPPKDKPKREKVMLDLLSSAKASSEVLLGYEMKIIKKYISADPHSAFPKQISLDLSKLNIIGDKANDLAKPSSAYNLMPLNQVLIIKLLKENTQELINTPSVNSVLNLSQPLPFDYNLLHSPHVEPMQTSIRPQFYYYPQNHQQFFAPPPTTFSGIRPKLVYHPFLMNSSSNME